MLYIFFLFVIIIRRMSQHWMNFDKAVYLKGRENISVLSVCHEVWNFWHFAGSKPNLVFFIIIQILILLIISTKWFTQLLFFITECGHWDSAELSFTITHLTPNTISSILYFINDSIPFCFKVLCPERLLICVKNCLTSVRSFFILN